MSIKQVVTRQYREIVNRTIKSALNITVPKEGWLKIVRKSLDMSAPQLAGRLDVTRALIYKNEKAEQTGSITLKKMSQIANAMDCKFVYAIAPKFAGETIEDYVEYKAKKMAVSIINKTNTNMALEAQALSFEKIEREVERLAQEILSTRPSDVWNEK